MLLYQITDAFKEARLNYALVGGYALALHGLVRATMDVDFVLSLNLEDFEKAEKTLAKLSLQSRIPVRAQDIIKSRKEFIEVRNLIAWSFIDYKDPSRQVDILINKDLKDLETMKISVGGRKVTTVTLQQLLTMKEEAGRPQDLVDAKNIRRKLYGKE